MPVKRKLLSDNHSEPLKKRRTRASGPLTVTQTASSARTPASRSPVEIPQSLSKRSLDATKFTKTRAKIHERDTSSSSLKENQLESADESSQDELYLSPSKSRSNRTAAHAKSRSVSSSLIVEVVIQRRRQEHPTSTARKRVEHLDPFPETPVKTKTLTTYASQEKKWVVRGPMDSPSPEPSPHASPSKRHVVAMTPPLNTAVVSPPKTSAIMTPVSSPKKNSQHSSAVSPSNFTPSPLKRPVITPASSPSKISSVSRPQTSPSRLSRALPPHLHSCFTAQKRAILCALQKPPGAHEADEDEVDDCPSTNEVASQHIVDLLKGTVARGEGNSCLLLGPQGSGKTRLVENSVADLQDSPIIVRLSGWVQHNDRLAMREIARQLTNQTGTSFLSSSDLEDEKEPNPFLDVDANISLPPPSHLPTLISALPTLSRPTIVILDGFDLFALHARQSLLYCLLDTVQSCRAGQGSKGLAVVGITTRIDAINLLEKRVKSRFSGRMFRTASPRRLECWMRIARNVLFSRVGDHDINGEWEAMWNEAVDKFLDDPKVMNMLKDTFSLTRDVRMLCRILSSIVLEATPASPFPTASRLSAAIASQRDRPRFAALHTLSYPSICLLIAAMHSNAAGREVVTFEMLYECFHNQVRASSAAPVQIEGGGIGMVRCTREVLMSAFEQLIATKLFVTVAPASSSVAKEFVKYRCVAQRLDVKKAVDMMGKTNLKKWLSKAQ